MSARVHSTRAQFDPCICIIYIFKNIAWCARIATFCWGGGGRDNWYQEAVQDGTWGSSPLSLFKQNIDYELI